MKFKPAIIALVATSTASVAIPSPNENVPPATTPAVVLLPTASWCSGTFCHKKRDTAVSLSNASESASVDATAACLAAGQSCDMVKRAAFAINDILKRHAESDATPCTPGSFCAEKFVELGDIASSAIDGYDYVTEREAQALGERSVTDDSEDPNDLIDYCDKGTTFCVRRRTADPEVSRVLKRCVSCASHPLACPPEIMEECDEVAHLHWTLDPLRSISIAPTAERHVSMSQATQTPSPLEKRKRPPFRYIWGCGVPGSPCFKRDLDGQSPASDEAPKSLQERGRPPFRYVWGCGVPGSPCFKRDLDGHSSASVDAPKHLEERGRPPFRYVWGCGVPGSPCFKRDLDHDSASVETPKPLQERGRPPFRFVWGCGVPGSPCFRKRDDISEEDHQDLFQEGGIANSLYDISNAIKATKNNAAAQRAIEGPNSTSDRQSGRAAWLLDGPSADALPYFHDIEDRVANAMYSLQQEE